jgi:Ser/Thr protein kinase RdoA (MazF antagonist)
VDASRRSPLADSLAAMWGYPAGTARFFRSSASHVFALETPTGRSAFLRFVPARVVERVAVEATATLTDRLASHGIGTVAALRSKADRLVETAGGGDERMHAMVVCAAQGRQIDVDDLTAGTARAWERRSRGGIATAARWQPTCGCQMAPTALNAHSRVP